MTKRDYYDIQDNEVLLKVTKDDLSKIHKALSYVQNKALERLEENRENNPVYEYQDELDRLLQANYTAWCELQTRIEGAEF